MAANGATPVAARAAQLVVALVLVALPARPEALSNARLARSSLASAARAGVLQNPRAARCFSAYVDYSRTNNLAALRDECSAWRDWVSTDGHTPDKVHAFDHAVVLGHSGGNNKTNIVGSIADIAIDVGGGFSSSRVAGGISTGVHILSIPVTKYRNCCGSHNGSLAFAISERRTNEVCSVLHDSIKGGLAYAGNYTRLGQAKNPHDKQAFSQCYHRRVDVDYLHLHTTAGVRAMREVASLPGDDRRRGETQLSLSPWGYNACVCEPSGRPGGRGHCPTAQPYEEQYLYQATRSLCRNVGGAGGIDKASIEAVCGACNKFHMT